MLTFIKPDTTVTPKNQPLKNLNMVPPAKKVKKSNDEPKSVIYTARGLNSDVRLRAFDTEFHVHSTVLKMHSAFFFKFLDSPDKTPPATVAPGTFKYEWVTKIDEDGSWSLVDARSIEVRTTSGTLTGGPRLKFVLHGQQKRDTQFDKFKGDKTKELIAFEKLLRAIYGEVRRLRAGLFHYYAAHRTIS
jgi:hypothetical protein